MDADWCEWNKKTYYFKKEGIYNELWRIWWSICTTRIKRKVK